MTLRFSQSSRRFTPYHFHTLLRSAQYEYYPRYVIRFLYRQDDHCRLAVVIAKKYVRKAVQRNYIARRIREIVRMHQDNFSCIWIMIQIKNILIDEDYHTFQQWCQKFSI